MTAPAWLTALHAEHEVEYYGVNGNFVCCQCGEWDQEEDGGTYYAHVAAVVWAEIEKRLRDARPAIDEAIELSSAPTALHCFPQADAAIDAALTYLGADDRGAISSASCPNGKRRPTMSDTDRLAQIEARLAAATPGPWEWDRARHGDDILTVVVAPDFPTGDERVQSVTMDALPADAVLIANAPADLRYLLDRVREAEEALSSANAHIDLTQGERNEWQDRAEQAEAALARVRALFAGGPDTVCRTTWRDEPPYACGSEVACVEVPLADLRAALGQEADS